MGTHWYTLTTVSDVMCLFYFGWLLLDLKPKEFSMQEVCIEFGLGLLKISEIRLYYLTLDIAT